MYFIIIIFCDTINCIVHLTVQETGELIQDIFENNNHSLALVVAKDFNKNVSNITWFEENQNIEYGIFAFEYPFPCPRKI